MKRLLEQPSIIAQRVENLTNYFLSLCNGEGLSPPSRLIEEDEVLVILLNNMGLINKYLLSSPLLHSVITSPSFSPFPSPSPSPLHSLSSSLSSSTSLNHSTMDMSSESPSTISSASSSPAIQPQPSDLSHFIYDLGGTLPTTVGRITRSGIVKVRLVELLTSLLQINSLRAFHSLILARTNSTILVTIPTCHLIHSTFSLFIRGIVFSIALFKDILLLDYFREVTLFSLISCGVLVYPSSFKQSYSTICTSRIQPVISFVNLQSMVIPVI